MICVKTTKGLLYIEEGRQSATVTMLHADTGKWKDAFKSRSDFSTLTSPLAILGRGGRKNALISNPP